MKRLATAAPWLAASLGVAITLWVFYPGYMSWDSAFQWWQMRHALYDPAHPPVMAGLWSLTDRVLPGPGGYFAYQTLLYWCALAALMSALRLPPILRCLCVLLLGFWPPIWGLSAQLWKDVAMMSWFAVSVALLCRDLATPSRALRLLALLTLALACAYRYNAIVAALPLALWLGWREMSLRYGAPASRLLSAMIGGVFLAAVALLATVPARVLHVASVPIWPTIAQWDIAAVSIAENHLLYPPHWSAPDLSVPELRAAFDPAVNTTIFATGKVYVNLYTPMTDADFSALRDTWISLPLQHREAYLRHRWRVTQLLLGWDRAAHPDGLVFSAGEVAFKDNPPVLRNASGANARVQEQLQSLIATPLFAGWMYLLLALAVFVGASFDRQRPGAGLAMAVAASALLLVLPLTIFAPSTDFRYLSWLLLAAPVSLLIWFTAGTRAAKSRPR